MDVDPKTTSGSDVAGQSSGQGQPLPPTESIAGALLKGRYLLGQELARGGFGVTYLAADLEVASRKVVVKILHDFRTRDSWALKKFQSEMESLARIDHPNVVSVLDFGHSAEGKPFLFMQYVRGRSLRELLPRDGLPLAQAAHILKQAGRALSAAHEAGVCHRDLKPENIMIQSDAHGEQQIKLIDFGLASIADAGENSSSTSVAGTYSYMAPEQLHGKFSFATDVFQMGVVAYELVTGVKPFRATTPGGIVLEHMEGLRVLPKSLRPNLPEAAQAIILKAISRQPEDRYQSASEFGDELAAALVSGSEESLQWVRPPSTASSRRTAAVLMEGRLERWHWIVITAAIAALLCTAAYFVWRTWWSGPGPVAVLPFENRTGDPGLAYLTEGITESLINDLSHIPTLRVIARGSVLKYEGSKIDPQTVGRQLGVARVIDGSVSRNGDEFHLDTELIEVQTGVRLWSYAYSAKLSSFTDMLQQFSAEVTNQLRLKLSGTLKERLKRQYAAGSESYQDYLRGRFHLNKRTAADFQEAIRYFNQAIAADSEYAPAYSGLADTYGLMALFGSAYSGAIPQYSLEQTRAAAKRALQLDSTLAEAYAALAFVEMQSDYDWKNAELNFKTSIELDPGSPTAHEWYAFELGASGRFTEAIREIKNAADLDPNSLGVKIAYGLILRIARQNDQSLALLRPITTDPVARGMVSDDIAEDYWAKSMPEEALAAVQNIPESFTPHLRIPLLIAGYARAGQTREAQKLLDSYVVRPDTAWWYYLALAHLGLKQKENAVQDLENAYEQRYREVIWLAVDPMLDELRTNVRFRLLLKRIHRDQN
jgi:eukaryotic-like serine/threonine-protein kinase